MGTLLKLSRTIDALNARAGMAIIWLVLVVTIISVTNAVIHEALGTAPDIWVEVQWHVFSAIFLLCAGYALLDNARVAPGDLASRLGSRTHAWIDIVGTLLFLVPMTVMILWLSSEVVFNAFQATQPGGHANGLVIWPARIMVPLGFAVLVLQGVSELIKRLALLGRGAHAEADLAHLRQLRGSPE